MTDFNVETDVPMPEHLGRGRQPKYRWEKLQVGDSVMLPKKNRDSVTSSYDYYSRTKTNNEAKFICRVEQENQEMIRVWRIK
tara:strand:+ start:837 stop:1082 length:246 start_codon:yes stop_codon:yes gene_type:complete